MTKKMTVAEATPEKIQNGYHVKNVKSFMNLDGLAFSATLYKDKSKIAIVMNDGMGGPDHQDVLNEKLYDEFLEHIKTLPNIEGHGIVIPYDEEIFVHNLVEQKRILTDFKKKAKDRKNFHFLSMNFTQTGRLGYSRAVKESEMPKVLEVLKEREGKIEGFNGWLMNYSEEELSNIAFKILVDSQGLSDKPLENRNRTENLGM